MGPNVGHVPKPAERACKYEVGSAYGRLAYFQEYINTDQKQPHLTSQATGGPYGGRVTVCARPFHVEGGAAAEQHEREDSGLRHLGNRP